MLRILLLLIVFHFFTNGNPFVQSLYIFEPCCHDFVHKGALFGPRLPFSPNAGLKLDLVHSTTSGCPGSTSGVEMNKMSTEVILNKAQSYIKSLDPSVFEGKAVIVPRGDCAFIWKVYTFQQLGAKAVIVYDNDPKNHELVPMGDDGKENIEITIPSVFVTHSTGMMIINGLLPAKVDLFRADEEWIAPMLDIPIPLLAVFFLLMITIMLATFNSLIRSCYRFRYGNGNGQNYAINNRGLLEPLGANVVIIDGSIKEQLENERDDDGEVYCIPATLQQTISASTEVAETEASPSTQVSSSISLPSVASENATQQASTSS